jgi:hypothetical protein
VLTAGTLSLAVPADSVFCVSKIAGADISLESVF